MTKGKVVLLPFPFDGLSHNKVRPVVCLTDPLRVVRHVILDFMTSQMPNPRLDTDFVLDPSDPDFNAIGLLAGPNSGLVKVARHGQLR
jgi:mRNA interferase MazF